MWTVNINYIVSFKSICLYTGFLSISRQASSLQLFWINFSSKWICSPLSSVSVLLSFEIVSVCLKTIFRENIFQIEESDIFHDKQRHLVINIFLNSFRSWMRINIVKESRFSNAIDIFEVSYSWNYLNFLSNILPFLSNSESNRLLSCGGNFMTLCFCFSTKICKMSWCKM